MSCLLSEQTIGAQLIFPLRSDVFSASQSFPEALGILSEQSCAIWAFGAPRRSVSFVGKVPSFIFLEGKKLGTQVALVVKNPPANTGDLRDAGSIPGLGRSPGGGHGSPLQYSCLENPMNRGAWWLQSIGSHRAGCY